MSELGANGGIYRATTVGLALTKSLNTMIEAGTITTEQAMKIRDVFDEEVEGILRNNLVLKKGVTTVHADGKLSEFTNLREVWKIDAENVEMMLENGAKLGENKKVRFLFA